MTEKLHNGIELPDPWPPRSLDPQSTDTMPVPYLDQPPEAIPIDAGRQLFVDDFLMRNTSLKRTFHSAEKYKVNPVFSAETDESLKRRAAVYLGHGGVFFDTQDNVFKMFYVDGWRGPMAMAASVDMINWVRPELEPGQNNILMDRKMDDNSIWLDLDVSEPRQRLKLLELRRPYHYLSTSPDGQSWSPSLRASIRAGDYCSFFYNPFRRVWGFSIKSSGPAGERVRSYCEHPDFLKGADWTRSVHWTGADCMDDPEPEGRYPGAGDPPQLYSLNAVAYESIMIGMHYIHRGPANSVCEHGKFPKLTDLELGFSRDGFHWHRPDRSGFIRGERMEGAWDRAYLHSTTGVFVICGDRLVFPYTGFSGIAPDGSRGMYHGGSIGVAFLRRDGFASMDAGLDTGSLTTRTVTFSGKYLFINAAVTEGRLRAEIRDLSGNPVAPFTLADSIPFTDDSTIQHMRWKNGDDLSALSGKPVQFHFELANGSLYAFWVSPDETGRSGGYLAAGASGCLGLVDTIGHPGAGKSTDNPLYS